MKISKLNIDEKLPKWRNQNVYFKIENYKKIKMIADKKNRSVSYIINELIEKI